MVDKVALGRKGEIFVMQKLMERGWKFPKEYHQNLDGLDWVFEKNGRKIKIQVKTSLRKTPKFSIRGKWSFDYLIVTNLNDLWIIPNEMLSIGKVKITKTFKRLTRKYHLLELLGTKLLNAINDCGIRYSDIDMPSKFFRGG